MSSRKSAPSQTAAEPSREEKAAFVKAMLKGIVPGTAAAEATAAKRAGKGTSKPAAEAAPGKKSSGKKSSGKKDSGKKALVKKTSDKKSSEKSSAKKASAKKAADTPVTATEETHNRVEILRKIAAPAPVVTTAKSAEVIALAKEIEKAIEKGDLDFLQPHAVQAMFQALIKLYGANDENGNLYPVLPGRLAVTGTDAMVVCGALLRAVDLQVFELGMFQSWSGR